MAIVTETTSDFASFSGVPTDDVIYDTLLFGFKSIAVKIIVTAGTLHVSVNKSDVNQHMTLPVGQYDFHGLAINKLHIRQTGATAQVLAWTD